MLISFGFGEHTALCPIDDHRSREADMDSDAWFLESMHTFFHRRCPYARRGHHSAVCRFLERGKEVWLIRRRRVEGSRGLYMHFWTRGQDLGRNPFHFEKAHRYASTYFHFWTREADMDSDAEFLESTHLTSPPLLPGRENRTSGRTRVSF
jgi:hypothetical protein